MISPIQFRMARAASGLSMAYIADLLGVSRQAINRYEDKGEGLGYAKLCEFETWCRKNRIYFGPAQSVSIDQDAMAQERWMVIALSTILYDHGIYPSSADLIAAYDKATMKREI